MYLDVLWFLNFVIDFFLLVATNRLAGYRTTICRTIFAAVIGGVYGCVCVLPGWIFLAGTLWRLVFLGIIAIVAFGFSKDSFRRCVLFVLLSMALGGLALVIGWGGFFSLLIYAFAVCLMCIFGLRGKLGNRFLPVLIRCNGLCHQFTAMIDTGNTLADPITGQQILVVSSKLGQRLLEDKKISFSDPISVLPSIHGGRLIPYHTVGTKGGLLVAKQFSDVTIGKWHGSCLVAFSPQEFGRGEGYEALTGGNSWG